jgi:hypothetical protein
VATLATDTAGLVLPGGSRRSRCSVQPQRPVAGPRCLLLSSCAPGWCPTAVQAQPSASLCVTGSTPRGSDGSAEAAGGTSHLDLVEVVVRHGWSSARVRGRFRRSSAENSSARVARSSCWLVVTGRLPSRVSSRRAQYRRSTTRACRWVTAGRGEGRGVLARPSGGRLPPPHVHLVRT